MVSELFFCIPTKTNEKQMKNKFTNAYSQFFLFSLTVYSQKQFYTIY